MKKALIITGLTLASVLALTGCGDNANETAAINNLSHQLDRVTNTVSAISNGSEKQVDIQNISQTQSGTYSDAYQQISEVNQNISSTKTQILQKVKSIKKQLVDGVKLGNSNTNAISELTSAMQRNNNNLNKTKSDFNRSVSGISKLKSSPDDKLMNARLTRLSCCMSARECYLRNILSSLESIESILNGIDETPETAPEQSQTEQTQPQQPQFMEEPEQTAQDETMMNANYAYPYGSNGVNGAYGAYGGAYGYGNGANGYGFNKFNPSRNTDTYGPGITNIDTYRFNSNPNNAFHNGMYGGGYAPLNQAENSEQEESQEQQQDVTLPSEMAKVRFESPRSQPRENPDKRAPRPATTRDEAEQTPATQEENADESLPDQDLKIKTVSLTEEHDETEHEPEQEVEELSPEENLQGSDKPKGHTKTLANITLDINKKIKDLIKG